MTTGERQLAFRRALNSTSGRRRKSKVAHRGEDKMGEEWREVVEGERGERVDVVISQRCSHSTL